MLCKACAKIWILGLANVTDGSQGGLLEGVVSAGHILDKNAHQLRPLIARQLDGGNRNDKGSSGTSGANIRRLKGLERKLLDLGLGLGVDALGPSELHLAQLGLIPESESVLQGNTGSDTDMRRTALVGKFLTESNKVGSLSDNGGISVQIPSKSFQ